MEKMNKQLAIRTIQGFTDNTDRITEAWQFLVNTGDIWTLSDAKQEIAVQLIDNGVILPPFWASQG